MENLEKLLTECHQWQIDTFGEATSLSKLHHLAKEVKELIEEMEQGPVDLLGADPEGEKSSEWRILMEYADCFLLLFGSAMKYGLSLRDIEGIIEKKLAINKQRKWGKPDKDGVVEHID